MFCYCLLICFICQCYYLLARTIKQPHFAELPRGKDVMIHGYKNPNMQSASHTRHIMNVPVESCYVVIRSKDFGISMFSILFVLHLIFRFWQSYYAHVIFQLKAKVRKTAGFHVKAVICSITKVSTSASHGTRIFENGFARMDMRC